MKRKGSGFGCLVVLLLGGIAIWVATTHEDRPSQRKNKARPDSSEQGLANDPSVGLPKYEVVDRQVYDAPIKTQIALDLLVVGDDLTSGALRNLLVKVFHESDNERGFKYHPTPTHVFIYGPSSFLRMRSS
jgi:hypothetical protein